MNKLVLVLIFLINVSCFARTPECNNIIRKVDAFGTECVALGLVRTAGDEATLIASFGSLKAADEKKALACAGWTKALGSMLKLKPKCSYEGSEEEKASRVILNKIRKKYGFI